MSKGSRQRPVNNQDRFDSEFNRIFRKGITDDIIKEANDIPSQEADHWAKLGEYMAGGDKPEVSES